MMEGLVEGAGFVMWSLCGLREGYIWVFRDCAMLEGLVEGSEGLIICVYRVMGRLYRGK